jgi:hypothetical protein
MPGKLGRWTVEVEAGPGQLSLKKPLGDARSRIWAGLSFAIFAGLLYGLATSADALWTYGGQSGRVQLVVGLVLLLAGGAWQGLEAVRQLFNVLHLQVRNDALVLRCGPVPRWRQHSVQLEWIESLAVDWPPGEHEDPGMTFTLRNGRTESFPFPETWESDLRIAAALVRTTLVPAGGEDTHGAA